MNRIYYLFAIFILNACMLGGGSQTEDTISNNDTLSENQIMNGIAINYCNQNIQYIFSTENLSCSEVKPGTPLVAEIYHSIIKPLEIIVVSVSVDQVGLDNVGNSDYQFVTSDSNENYLGHEVGNSESPETIENNLDIQANNNNVLKGTATIKNESFEFQVNLCPEIVQQNCNEFITN